MNKKKTYLVVLQWILVVAAYAYLIYRLATFDDYNSFLQQFRSASYWQWVTFVMALAFFPLNILCEAVKWKYLLQEVEPMSLSEAQRQTYFGFVGAFLTPSRIGDYPARVTMLHDKSQWLTAIGLGFVGTLALAFLQVLCGLPACIIIFTDILPRAPYTTPLAVICTISLLLQFLLIAFYPSICSRILQYPVKKEKIRLLLQTLAGFSHQRFFTTCLLSALRYAVYCLQLWCVLYFCGINLGLYNSVLAITAYYLLVTITPSVPIADAAVRGSWSIIIFGAFTPNIAGVAMAAVLLWILNSILPMITGTFMKKSENKTPLTSISTSR